MTFTQPPPASPALSAINSQGVRKNQGRGESRGYPSFIIIITTTTSSGSGSGSSSSSSSTSLV